MEVIDEKSSSPLAFLTDNVISATLTDVYSSLSERRRAMGLENPGTVDNISREVQKDVLTSNHMFSGLRCDVSKMFSVAPMFRMQHAFSIGSPALPSWQMMALYGSSQVFMQGTYSSDRSVAAWGNVRWTPSFTSKSQMSISPGQGSMLTLDNEYVGDDFTASLKAVTPSILEGGLTGIYVGSYLQSITPKIALGVEGVWQRAALNARPETAMSYCARYKEQDWIASAQFLSQGVVGASYWRRLTDRVEAGVDSQLQFAPGMSSNGLFGATRKEGSTTVGMKYSFQTAIYRAQVDSAGKLSVVLEKRVAPPVTLTFAAEIDQVKQTHKLGVAISLDNISEDVAEVAERVEQAGQVASPPF